MWRFGLLHESAYGLGFMNVPVCEDVNWTFTCRLKIISILGKNYHCLQYILSENMGIASMIQYVYNLSTMYKYMQPHTSMTLTLVLFS